MKIIEVFADIWCPFAHVGIRCVIDRRIQLLGRDDALLHVRAWPLELVNGAPLDPITTACHVEELRQVAPDLFQGFDQGHFPTSTLPALAWVSAAYERDVRHGEAVSLALRNALFEGGVDISDPDALLSIARSVGIESFDVSNHEAVMADWAEGRSRGVKGSPHFFCGDNEESPSVARHLQGWNRAS